MRMLERPAHEEDGAATAKYVIATLAAVALLELMRGQAEPLLLLLHGSAEDEPERSGCNELENVECV